MVRIVRLLVLTFLLVAVTGCAIHWQMHASHHKKKINHFSAGLLHRKQIVLLRKGPKCYGAFIAGDQISDPDNIEFKWYFRTDGKGSFKRSEMAKYKSGTGVLEGDDDVPWGVAHFGPFKMGWSGCQNGSGWIYYPKFPEETVLPNDVRICLTKERDLGKINATDLKWVYKAYSDDPGIRANGKKVSAKVAPKEYSSKLQSRSGQSGSD
jgi:hypothetical protein